MSNLTTRAGKGSPLTNNELDANFTNLNSDKVEIGGDLSGTSSAPNVAKIQGRAVSSDAPAAGEKLVWNGTAWEPSADPSGEPIGHADKSQSSISFNNGNRTFSISPVSTSFDVWCKGVKYTYSTAQSVVIPNTTGLHFIYFSASGVLSTQMSYFTWEEHAPTAYVYWNSTTQQAIYFGDERHGVTLDWQTHEYLHRTRGAAIASGFGASNYTTTGTGATDADAQIDIGGGTFFDEDMQIDVVSTNTPVAGTWQQDLSGPALIPVLYLSGSAWVIDAPTNFPFKVVSGVPQYNLFSGGTWSTAAVANNEYFVSWILATNNLTYPVIAIISQAPTNQLSAAEAMTFEGLTLSGFPSVEFRPLYKVIYQHKNVFANSVKASTIAVYDLRSLQSAGVAAALVQDHGNLSGLGDDDHAQYLHVSEVRSPSSAVKNSFLPTQAGQSGKYLTTDGSNPSWGAIPSGSLSFTGDVTGSGTTGSSTTLTLSNSGATAGTYSKVTVDAKGRVTTGTSISNTDVTTALGFTPEDSGNKGVANGYASLDGSGKVPSTQLPSYVDDVLEYANLAALPGTGESGKIYITIDTAKTYRWSGSAYVEISASPGSTDAVPEGSTNLYFTNSRARGAITATGSLSYNNSTGVLSYTQPTNVSTFNNDSAYITSSASITGNAATATKLAAGRTIAVTGDVTGTSVEFDGSANLSFATTLANSGVTAGTYGSSSAVPVVTVDAKGRVTGVSTSAISGSITFTGDVTGSGTTGSSTALTLANSGVTAGTYQSVTVDAKGRVTAGTSPGYLTGNQTITLSGDASGSGATGISVTLANSGVTAGTYTKVTVDAKGRVTVGTALASADLPTYTGAISSSQVTTALGFTPYNSTNPNNYITSSSNITGTAAGITGYTLDDVNGTATSVMTRNSGGDSSVGSRFYFKNCTADGGTFGIIGLSWGGAAGTYKDFEVYDYVNSRPLFRAWGSTRNFDVYGALSAASINLAGQTGSIGYNSTTNLGTYIKGTGDTYVYGGGEFYDGTASRQILTSGNYSSYTVARAGGSYVGRVVFPSGVFDRPQLPGGILGLDTGDGNFDIWGISRDYYPSHATASNAWGIRWDGDSNQVRFIGAGTTRLAVDLDGGASGLTWEGNTVLHVGNYNDYAPSKSGTGANGTWGIRITGFANQGGPRLYSTDGAYNYDSGSPYYGYLTYNSVAARWRFKVSPATPDAVEVAYADTAGSTSSATSAIRLTFNDGPRDLSDRFPNSFTRTVNFDFVNAGSGNGTGNYAGVMTFSPWTGTTASTGDSSYQLSFGNNSGVNASGQPRLSIRNGIDTTWNSWYTLLHSGNYGSYALPLSGGTLTGTIYVSTSGAGSNVRALRVGPSGGSPASFGSYTGSWRSAIEIWDNAATRMLHLTPPDGTNYNYSSIKSTDAGLRIDVGGSGGTNAVDIGTNGVANFPQGLQQGGNQVLHLGNYSTYALSTSGGTVTGAIRASQITAGGSTNTDANLGVQGSTHLTGTIYYGGTVGNVNSWSSISTSSGGTHTFSGSRFIFDRYGYGSQPLIDLQSSSITLSQPTYAGSGITVNNASADGRGINLYNGSPTSPEYGLFFAQTANFGTYGSVYADWATYFTMNSTAGRGWIFRQHGSPMNVAAISNAGEMTLRSHFEQGNNIARPNVSWSAGSTSTGMVIFYLPGTTSNYGMVHMVFDIYEYNGNAVSTVIVGGHNWSTSWYNVSANVIGQCGKEVRLGCKDGRFCVVFGTSGSSWEYGTIVLRKIHNGGFYDNVMNMTGDWSATQTTTESFTNVTGDLRALRTPASFNAGGAITQAGNQVLHAGNYTNYFFYNTWDEWLRDNGDNNQFKIYGNTRTLIFRTDGSDNPHGGGGYSAIWYHGGSADANRRMILGTSGDLWTNSYGWLHDYFLPKSGGTLTGTINFNGTMLFPSGGGGVSFAANHYSMGKDVANGSWTHPHYSDLIIGYHTGIRIGAAYSGIRFYNNSPTTDANNDGNGDGGESLLMTIGGHAAGSGVIINNSLTAYGSVSANDVYTTGGWFRNHTNNNGIYWSQTGWHLYPANAGSFYVRSGTSAGSLWFIDSGASSLGYVHAASDAAMGFLTTGGNWRFRVDNSGNARCYNNLYLDQNYGHGIVGLYASTRYQGVFAMGDSYKLPADGTSAGNLYGIAWSYPSAGGVAGNLDSHGMLVLINGGFGSCMSYSIKASGNVTAYSDERLKTNWRPMPENFVERLAQVRVGIYDRTDGEKITQVGIGAQSLQKLLPEAITKAGDEMGTLSVSYGNAAMASAVELAKELVMLKKELAELKSRLH